MEHVRLVAVKHNHLLISLELKSTDRARRSNLRCAYPLLHRTTPPDHFLILSNHCDASPLDAKSAVIVVTAHSIALFKSMLSRYSVEFPRLLSFTRHIDTLRDLANDR